MIRRPILAIALLALSPLIAFADEAPAAPLADCSATPYQGKLTINSITGGREQSMFRAPSIPNEDYAAALKDTLTKAGLMAADPFAPGVIPLSATFTHEVERFKSTINTVYTLSGTDTGEKNIEIAASYTGKRTDAFGGATISKMATAKALQVNLSDFVQKLCQP